MEQTNLKPFVFVLMPFEPKFYDRYEFGIKAACKEVDAHCERVDEQFFVGNILDQVYDQIAKADIIIAEMTGRNPNVFYETGYAHALHKRVILLVEKAEEIPFDLKHYPHILYEGSIATLKAKLEETIRHYKNEPSPSKPNTQEPSTASQIFANSDDPKFASLLKRLIENSARIVLIGTGFYVMRQDETRDKLLAHLRGGCEIEIYAANPFSPNVETRLIEEEIGTPKPTIRKHGLETWLSEWLEKDNLGPAAKLALRLFPFYPTYALFIFEDRERNRDYFFYPYGYAQLGTRSPVFHYSSSNPSHKAAVTFFQSQYEWIKERSSEAELVFDARANKKIERETYLFGLNLDLVGELDKGMTSDAVRQQFQTNRYFLTPQFQVRVNQASSNWTILDGNAEYSIRNENRTLNVYRETLTAFAVYLIPFANSKLYQFGSRILQYDVRAKQMLRRKGADKWREAIGAASDFGLHVTVADALYCAGVKDLDLISKEVWFVAKEFNPFKLSLALVKDFPNARGIALKCEDKSGTLEALHHEMVARVYRKAVASNYSPSIGEAVADRDLDKERAGLMIERYHAPYILQRFTPHFSLLSDVPPERKDELYEELKQRFEAEMPRDSFGMPDLSIEIRSIAVMYRPDPKGRWQIRREYPLKGVQL